MIDFVRHTLGNGLRVILAPDPSLPVVAVNLWYGVGSRNEKSGKTGFAHLFEHMMFQGSQNVPKGAHFELVERAGGTLNASTWFDRTNYYETLPSHQLDLALWLEADRMGWLLPSMTQEKLDNQRDVVRNERRERYDNQPYGDWDERLLEMVFPNDHPSHHSVIGSMEDLARADLSDVADFFSTFYGPNNAVLTLTGDFEVADGLDRIERYFGEIPSSPAIPAIPGRVDVEPLIGGEVRQEVRAEVPLPRIYFGARIPPVTSPEFHSVELAVALLAEGRASRLYRRLVRERRVAKDAGGYAYPLCTGHSLLLFRATGFPGADPAILEGALAEEVQGLADIDSSELERVVTQAETEFALGLEQLASRADLLSMHEMTFGDAAHLAGEMERIRSVTPAQIRDFAANYLVPENRAVLTYLPKEDA
jgi:predicted Zn-dependent peptidase